MTTVFLQSILNNISLSNLPYNWNSFDLKTFSKNKTLWEFQQKAIENALKLLWKYYKDFYDFQSGETIDVNRNRKEMLFKTIDVNRNRKEMLFKWYKDNGLENDLDIKLNKRNRKINKLLTEYFPQEDGKIPYSNYINRMCFWMATGSGKTIVIIKLIQILKQLMERGEIPEYDILFLTHRNDLLEQ
ncbi:DEAD/DEAH box helicase family protein, partial [Peptococcaceae bacterium]|nr:DEAD/DEAH box helicase family protein [Peptococcaceae bacterium]